ncbi:hypothetical protein PHLCEN_2v530 [Hermanssonia centrifuga]|uniref:UBC core domain-containing protein n=1 Tax=Hermanssonia centrifuga TaxID=98765 RepID=A0A2R6S5S4_9APHY|nr:hypothetical protein PHLCEN_2v530 [Hermanssonia centrifuga]
MNQGRRRTPAKFYQEDIVQLVDRPKVYGVVLRCWHDAEDLPPPAEHLAADPLLRPLKHGEVGVSFFSAGLDIPQREILLETKLQLVDRMYQPGDILKRSIEDVRSGIVTGIDVRGRVEHAISSEPIPGWKSMNEVECYIDVDMGDYIVYNDWVGQMFDEAMVEMESGALVRLPELSARLAVGERGPNILPPPTPGMHSLIGFLLGNARPGNQDTVLNVKRTVLAVAWLAINQSLDPAEAAERPRPQRFWHGADLSKLTLVRRRAEQAMRVGDRVNLKDSENSPVTVHGREGEPPGLVEVKTLVVKETRTLVHVLWQDGTRETLDAKDTVPYINPDEYDCWPGDHVIWKSEDSKRPAIIQSVNAVDRIALIRFTDTGNVELTSVLELDPHGASDWSSVSPVEGLGLHRGEFVFIHKEGTTNGAQKPMVPRIGEVEDWVRESLIIHLRENGHMGGWRRELAEIGNNIAAARGKDSNLEEGTLQRPRKDDASLNWFGEVVDLRLDGTVEVMLPDATLTTLPLERVTRLYDGLEQLEDMWGDDMSESGDSYESDGEEELWTQDANGRWVFSGHVEEDDWSTDEAEVDGDAMDVDEEGWSSSDPTALQSADTSPPHMSPFDIEPMTVRPASPDVPKDAIEVDEDDRGADSADDDDDSGWKRFKVIPSAPPDHAFFSSSPAQPSRNFLARLQKEYRVLSNSLPETILVRAYEDRTDLLRCLIIGPENTPYEDAPFVIDWMLDSNFPHSPPVAHFLSWTNGNGREGKVCLSILGTWAGDKNETWSASRSSLLQAFVSIQGLVLVKEPWFCEPAYEKLRGTEEGIVNSRLYSEKAYVLSRGFVRRALEIPLGGLEPEIDWMYYRNGKLQKVVQDARALVDKSRTTTPNAADTGNGDAEGSDSDSSDRDLAVPRLTGGGIITLERTLAKLQVLLDTHHSR